MYCSSLDHSALSSRTLRHLEHMGSNPRRVFTSNRARSSDSVLESEFICYYAVIDAPIHAGLFIESIVGALSLATPELPVCGNMVMISASRLGWPWRRLKAD